MYVPTLKSEDISQYEARVPAKLLNYLQVNNTYSPMIELLAGSMIQNFDPILKGNEAKQELHVT
jgi:hypothetical protein